MLDVRMQQVKKIQKRISRNNDAIHLQVSYQYKKTFHSNHYTTEITQNQQQIKIIRKQRFLWSLYNYPNLYEYNDRVDVNLIEARA